jgi:hypothetical protein
VLASVPGAGSNAAAMSARGSRVSRLRRVCVVNIGNGLA